MTASSKQQAAGSKGTKDKRIAVTFFAFVCLLSTVFSPAVSTTAQQASRIHRIGFLGAFSPSGNPARTEAFLQGLRELGYYEGKNITIDYRWSEGKAERLPALAVELVRLQPDVIFTQSPQGAVAAKRATTTVPIVFIGIGDPVGTGIVSGLARPGGNITGLTNFSPELSTKRLEVLKESVPKISSVAVLWNGTSKGHPAVLKEIEIAASSLGLKLQSVEVRGPNDFDSAFEATIGSRAQALLPLPDPLMSAQLRRIIDFAAKNRLPAIYSQAEYIEAGGLMSYGPDNPAMFRRAATYVDKILKGANPAELPVEQPTKFELVINLKAAKQIGITIPPNVLARADRVIR